MECARRDSTASRHTLSAAWLGATLDLQSGLKRGNRPCPSAVPARIAAPRYLTLRADCAEMPSVT
eukprot:5535157-Alexandrium_andersonii.AAC.1